MTLGQTFAQELALEAAVTRRFLEKVPFDQLSFQPMEQSETLGRLAVHVAEILAWWTSCVDTNELNFEHFEPKVFSSNKELLLYFDELLEQALTTLNRAENETFEDEWSMTYGDEVLFKLPKKQVARLFCMNHLVHHRAQLGMYLRLLNIPVPATYGPSAEDEHVVLIQPFH